LEGPEGSEGGRAPPSASRGKLREAAFTALVVLLVFLALNAALREMTGTSSPLAVVRGRSMYPLLREGDVIFLEKKAPSEIEVGDVIVYRSLKGGLIVHRVIRVINADGTYYFQTKGDNNSLDDRFLNEYDMGIGVREDRVVGVAAKVGESVVKIPYLGSLSLWLLGRG